MTCQVSKANAKFAKMSKAEKRVAIARDVLKQLGDGKYKASQGRYLIINQKAVDKMNPKGELKKELAGTAAPICTVCARGAMFCSMIRKFNKFKVQNLFPKQYSCFQEKEYLSNNIDLDSFRSKESEFFGKKQLILIESAFEMYNMDCDHKISYNTMDKAVNFGKQYRHSSTERMIAIMKNIIKNKGTFVP